MPTDQQINDLLESVRATAQGMTGPDGHTDMTFEQAVEETLIAYCEDFDDEEDAKHREELSNIVWAKLIVQ